MGTKPWEDMEEMAPITDWKKPIWEDEMLRNSGKAQTVETRKNSDCRVKVGEMGKKEVRGICMVVTL